jgi:aminoglycoside phosphotransferase (APT) family kinase protein
MSGTNSHHSESKINKARALVREIVDHYLGSAKSSTRHLAGGKTNFVFEVRHGSEDLIVRINADVTKLQSFLKEQWVVTRVRKLGVPTPEILEVSNESVEWPYMISRRVTGSEATFHPRRARIIYEAGRYAAIINSVRTHGFGATFDWSENKLSRHGTWNEFLNEELQLSDRLKTLARHRLITQRTKEKLRSILAGVAKNATKPRLNHGDLRLKNVLVDKKGKITAIVDWEHSVSNIRAWELSVALHDLTIDEKQQFLSGYGIADKQMDQISPATKALNIINYAPVVENLTARERTQKLKSYRMRLKGYLDLYSI